MTTGRSQFEVKLQFGRQSRRGWSSTLILIIITEAHLLLYFTDSKTTKCFIVKNEFGFLLLLTVIGRKFENFGGMNGM